MTGQDVGLSAARLMDEACVQTGLRDYGDVGLEERVSCYLDDAVANAQLSPGGALGLEALASRQLVNRLRFHEDLRSHPEILAEEIDAPIIVTGLFRTVTTKLQRMLSADPMAQKLTFWKLLNIAPFPEDGDGEDTGRIAASDGYLEQIDSYYPEFVAAHRWETHDVDEEALLLWMTFANLGNACVGYLPAYLEFVRSFDQRENYRYLKRQLQYLQWQDGGHRGRPWVLKSPLHIGHLDALSETFPDATIVHCHRDPLVVAPSLARLMELFWKLFSDSVDLHQVGEVMLGVWSAEAARGVEVRSGLTGADIIDVRYEDICRQPMDVIDQIYRSRAATPDAESLQSMRDWELRNPQHAHGKNPYSLERYGYTESQVMDAFEAYRSAFFPNN